MTSQPYYPPPYHDVTGNTAAHRVDQERDAMTLGVVAGMAIQSLLSRQATNEQCASMVRDLSRWWGEPVGPGIDRTKWAITDHAAARAVEMGLSAGEIRALITNPEDTRVQGVYSKYTGYVLHFRGDYAAAVNTSSPRATVVTFLYRYQDGYDAQYAMPATGRERRTSNLPRKPK